TSKLCSRTGNPVPVAVLVLFTGVGSVVPGGGDTVAVLSIVMPFVVVPLIVTVTLLLAGNVVTEPLTVLPATFTELQTGLPVVGEHVGVPVIVTVPGTASVYAAPSAAFGPLLLISSV